MNFKNSIREKLVTQYKMYYEMDVDIEPDFLDVATYLDSRYKALDYLSDRHKNNVQQHVSEILGKRGPPIATPGANVCAFLFKSSAIDAITSHLSCYMLTFSATMRRRKLESIYRSKNGGKIERTTIHY